MRHLSISYSHVSVTSERVFRTHCNVSWLYHVLDAHVRRRLKLVLSYWFAFDVGVPSRFTLAKLLGLSAAAGVLPIILNAHVV